MSPKVSSQILVLLSMVYGGTIAVLALTDSGALTNFAVIGAIVLGILWVARSFFMKRPTSGDKP